VPRAERRDLTARPLRDRRPRCWVTPPPAASWCSRCGGWPRTALRRGITWSGADTRVWCPRTGQRVRAGADEALAEGEGAGWTVEGDGWQRRVSVAPSAR
jgi:hypothetical protein